jgi:aarF domain-containing kinase
VYEEQLERLSGSFLWPSNLMAFLRAWSAHMRVELKLTAYETWLRARMVLGMGQQQV